MRLRLKSRKGGRKLKECFKKLDTMENLGWNYFLPLPWMKASFLTLSSHPLLSSPLRTLSIFTNMSEAANELIWNLNPIFISSHLFHSVVSFWREDFTLHIDKLESNLWHQVRPAHPWYSWSGNESENDRMTPNVVSRWAGWEWSWAESEAVDVHTGIKLVEDQH